MNAAVQSAPTSGVRPALLLVVLLIVAAVVASLVWLNLPLGDIFSRAGLASAGQYLAEFLPPRHDGPYLYKVGVAAWETLAISAVATLLAAGFGGLLALPASGRYGRAPALLARGGLITLRSVPELVWATLMVLAAGLGSFAGTLALALHTTGVLGRLFAEALENAPAAPAAALAQAGAPAPAVFCYATLPLVLPQWVAYALYRWEMNIRMAAVLGFVGAGGLGQLLYFELSLFHQAEAGAVIAAMLLLTLLVDAASAIGRRRLVAAGH